MFFQADNSVEKNIFQTTILNFFNIGKVTESNTLSIKNHDDNFDFNISELRDTWYKTSYLLDQKQTANGLAKERFNNYKNQPLNYKFPTHFTGKLPIIANGMKQSVNQKGIISSQTPRNNKPKAAIIREKGSNSEREMANAMYFSRI